MPIDLALLPAWMKTTYAKYKIEMVTVYGCQRTNYEKKIAAILAVLK